MGLLHPRGGRTYVVELADLTIVAPNASGNVSGTGKSSYGVLVRNVVSGSVVLRRMSVTAGNGTSGIDGADAPNTSAVPLTTWHGQQ